MSQLGVETKPVLPYQLEELPYSFFCQTSDCNITNYALISGTFVDGSHTADLNYYYSTGSSGITQRLRIEINGGKSNSMYTAFHNKLCDAFNEEESRYCNSNPPGYLCSPAIGVKARACRNGMLEKETEGDILIVLEESYHMGCDWIAGPNGKIYESACSR
jgi:hypothetical protein